MREQLLMQRLGKNLTGYVGERLDINAVLADCVSAVLHCNRSHPERDFALAGESAHVAHDRSTTL